MISKAKLTDAILRALQDYDWSDGKGADAEAMAAFIATRVKAFVDEDPKRVGGRTR